MRSKNPSLSSPSRRLRRRLIMCAVGAIFGTTGVACQPAGSASRDQDTQLDALQSRIEEVERTNGRLTVRMEELEDQIFLLNDRVESHRIALQRRGYKSRYQPDAYASKGPKAPSPAPESYYYQGGPQDGYAAGTQTRQAPRRPVTRIPLSQQQDGAQSWRQKEQTSPQRTQPSGQPSERPSSSSDEEVVISEDEFRQFSGQRRQTKQPASPSSSGQKRQPQADVTSERLTSEQTSSKPAPAPEKSPASSSTSTSFSSTGLRLYKDSLAAYRAGEYARALAGFEAFLGEGPKSDYVDNALYWIGECHYGLGNYDSAVDHFERVLKEQPDGNKVPDSMLKMSLALEQMGEQARAERVLMTLTQRYPMTNAAKLGSKRLNGHSSPQ